MTKILTIINHWIELYEKYKYKNFIKLFFYTIIIILFFGLLWNNVFQVLSNAFFSALKFIWKLLSSYM